VSKKTQLLGFIWLGFALWDFNAYYTKISIPNFVFWWLTLPFAIGIYITFGILLLLGKIGWKSKLVHISEQEED